MRGLLLAFFASWVFSFARYESCSFEIAEIGLIETYNIAFGNFASICRLGIFYFKDLVSMPLIFQ